MSQGMSPRALPPGSLVLLVVTPSPQTHLSPVACQSLASDGLHCGGLSSLGCLSEGAGRVPREWPGAGPCTQLTVALEAFTDTHILSTQDRGPRQAAAKPVPWGGLLLAEGTYPPGPALGVDGQLPSQPSPLPWQLGQESPRKRLRVRVVQSLAMESVLPWRPPTGHRQ